MSAPDQDGAARRRDAERRLQDAGAALAGRLGVPWNVKRSWDLEAWRVALLDQAAALMELAGRTT